MTSRQQRPELLAVAAACHVGNEIHVQCAHAEGPGHGDLTASPPRAQLTVIEQQGNTADLFLRLPEATEDLENQVDAHKKLIFSEELLPAPAAAEVQRRALIIRWIDRGTLTPTLQNPRTYTKWQKMSIVLVVSLASFSAPFASNIMMPSFPFIGPRLKLNSTGVSLTTTLFLVALGIGPLYHAFLSERFGRRPVYLGGFVLYTLASVACALSPTGPTLILFRFIQAFGASAAQCLGIGTIADIYIPAERGRATGFWFLGPILGPTLSPLVGGAIYSWLGWRAILWTTAIFGAILTILIILFLPETSIKLKTTQSDSNSNPCIGSTTTDAATSGLDHRHTILSTKILYRSVKGTFNYGVWPLGTIGFLLSPSIFLPAFYSSVCFASLYALSVSTPFIFSEKPFVFKSVKISLLYLPTCVGYCIGSVLGGYLSDWEIQKAKAKSENRTYAPEVRLKSARWGIPLLPSGLIIYGWSAYKGDTLVVPLIGGFMFGVGLMLTNGTITAFLADAVPGKSASVVAAYNALRNISAGLTAAVTTMAIKSGLHVGWYMTMLALVSLFTSLTLEVVQVFGPRWRKTAQQRAEREAEQARLAQCKDLTKELV
ncbi:hypothetical protein FRB96_009286 [Tulasnella sp. 330]|nr:hypothetical protein FRB96_009286 [Tulasnella sp. 330]KAG8880866.1 hypothetical protein FRB97_000376 [Tulasnella sp. 331]KAG8887104.1 hypothetical protein FRB98_000574 [Tulasnella sp. 332]